MSLLAVVFVATWSGLVAAQSTCPANGSRWVALNYERYVVYNTDPAAAAVASYNAQVAANTPYYKFWDYTFQQSSPEADGEASYWVCTDYMGCTDTWRYSFKVVLQNCGTPPPDPRPDAQMCSATLPAAGSATTRPILPATAEKLLTETDYQGSGAHALTFRREYRSSRVTGLGRANSGLGQVWSHNHWATLQILEANLLKASVVMYDGSARVFTRSTTSSPWVPSGHKDSLAQVNGSPVYTRAEDRTSWKFDWNGKLYSVAQANGWTTTYVYAFGRVAEIQNAFGSKLMLDYDASGRLQSVTAPDGQIITYGYDAAGRLATVTYPGTETKTYHYENAIFPQLVTGITDETGQRLSTYGYDNAGRAISSHHGGELTTVSYPAAGTALVTDPLGTQRTFAYSFSAGRLAVTGANLPSSGPVRSAASRVQNAAGLTDSETDFLGVQTLFTWDTNRQLPISVTEAAGRPEARTTTTQWDPTFNLPSLITAPGRSSAYTYDPRGNRLTERVTDLATGQVRTRSRTYDAQGLAQTMTEPNGAVWQYAWSNGRLASATNPLGHVTSYTYDGAGRLSTETAPTGLVTTYTYDARSRVATVERGGQVTSFTYRPTGQIATASLPSGLVVTYNYDTVQRLTGWSSNRGAQAVFTLDAMGNRTEEQLKDAAGILVWRLARGINTLNLLSSETLGADQVTTYGRNANGQVTSSTNALSQSTGYTVDGLKRVTAITDEAGNVASIGYNALDGTTSVTDFKGVSTNYGRNAFGEPLQESSADIGSRSNTYDALGLPSRITDALGQATDITRDTLGRPTLLAFADGRSTILRYDLAGADYATPDAPSAGKGFLGEIEDRSGITRWQRDLFGRVTKKTQILKSGTTHTVEYGYNTQGLLETVTLRGGLSYPGGVQTRYVYDATGQVSGIDWNGQPLVTGITWNAAGQPTGWTWALGSGISASRTYDVAGRVTSTEHSAYMYDAAGRITSLTQNVGMPADTDPQSTAITFADVTFTVGYDALGRITGFNGGGRNTAFTYDANGNRLSSTATLASGTIARSYTVNSGSNRLGGFTQQVTGSPGASSEAVSYGYNANGDITGDGQRQFGYDAEGRLSSMVRASPATTTQYTHNALGQRLSKTDAGGGWAYVYDEDGSLLWEDGTGGPQSTVHVFLPGPNGPMPVAAIINGERFAVHSDHLNTPRRLTNAAGQAAWQWKYSAFGDEPATTAFNRFVDPLSSPGYGQGVVPNVAFHLRYPGQYADPESGLHYNYLRSYDAGSGRYTQPDPIGLDGGWNRFSYVEGNPLSLVDPTGLEPPKSPTFWCVRCGAPHGGLFGRLCPDCYRKWQPIVPVKPPSCP